MRELTQEARVFVAGHTGLVGSALVRALRRSGFSNLVLRSRSALDLLDQGAVRAFFASERIDLVFMAAAKVGGILANQRRPADFLYENLVLTTNVLGAAADHGVEKLLFLGSSCVYPRLAPQPIREEALLSGPLEPTNQGYAVAKIAGLELCEAFASQHGRRFVSAMPTNLYGPGDNFDPESSHVVPGLMRRLHEAQRAGAPEVVVWGTGAPLRELLHVDDLARALILLMARYEGPGTINVGSGDERTIRAIAEAIAEVVGYSGRLRFDPEKPDGTPRKRLDGSRLDALGFRPEIALETGLASTYRWALDAGRLV